MLRRCVLVLAMSGALAAYPAQAGFGEALSNVISSLVHAIIGEREEAKRTREAQRATSQPAPQTLDGNWRQVTTAAIVPESYETGSIPPHNRVVIDPGAMNEGRETQGPRAWQAMCNRKPELCAERSLQAYTDPVIRLIPKEQRAYAHRQVVVDLNPEMRRELEAVNLIVNKMVREQPDRGDDFWELNIVQGDCEDFALLKQQVLVRLGWPRSSVLIGVVEGDVYPYHAVLIVRTRQGDFVLDNLTDRVVDWKDTVYSWVIRESAADVTKWVRIEAADAAKIAKGQISEEQLAAGSIWRQRTVAQ